MMILQCVLAAICLFFFPLVIVDLRQEYVCLKKLKDDIALEEEYGFTDCFTKRAEKGLVSSAWCHGSFGCYKCENCPFYD